MVAIVLLFLLLALGAASLLGRTADSRDPGFGLAPMIGRQGTSPTNQP